MYLKGLVTYLLLLSTKGERYNSLYLGFNDESVLLSPDRLKFA